MFTRLFDRWSRSKKFYKNELELLRIFLPSNNKNAEKLFSQAINAPFIERKLIGANGYEAVIPYVPDDSMLIECDENLESPSIRVEATGGIALGFTTTILRGGFLRGLKGQTLSGEPWQREWTADLANVQVQGDLDMWLPLPMEIPVRASIVGALLQWAGLQRLSPQIRKILRVAVPATDAQIRACESRLQIRLSEQYREFLLISNGFGISRSRPYEFLGSEDTDFINGSREWLCLTPLYEDGCVAIRCKEGVATNECWLLVGNGAPRPIGDIKSFAREQLNKKME